MIIFFIRIRLKINLSHCPLLFVAQASGGHHNISESGRGTRDRIGTEGTNKQNYDPCDHFERNLMNMSGNYKKRTSDNLRDCQDFFFFFQDGL